MRPLQVEKKMNEHDQLRNKKPSARIKFHQLFEFRMRTSIPLHNKNANMINSVVGNSGAGHRTGEKKYKRLCNCDEKLANL